MIGLTWLEKGCIVPPHSRDNQRVTFVVSGKWRFRREGQTVDVGTNEMICIPAHAVHAAEAVETPGACDIFTPPREHWLGGQDACLRD